MQRGIRKTVGKGDWAGTEQQRENQQPRLVDERLDCFYKSTKRLKKEIYIYTYISINVTYIFLDVCSIEYGEELASRILPMLSTNAPNLSEDPSTNGLIAFIKSQSCMCAANNWSRDVSSSGINKPVTRYLTTVVHTCACKSALDVTESLFFFFM